MLLKGATRMGIAAVYAPKSKYKVFWALILAAPDERRAADRGDGLRSPTASNRDLSRLTKLEQSRAHRCLRASSSSGFTAVDERVRARAAVSSTTSQPCASIALRASSSSWTCRSRWKATAAVHRRAHRALQVRRPGVERRAMEEDRPRNVEVVGQRVEAVKLVHAVGHRVGERVLLRVDACRP